MRFWLTMRRGVPVPKGNALLGVANHVGCTAFAFRALGALLTLQLVLNHLLKLSEETFNLNNLSFYLREIGPWGIAEWLRDDGC